MQEVYKTLAEQLKKPHGELAIQVGEKMNEVNETVNLLSIDALDLQKGDNILEIGMSNGFFVKKLFEKQADIHYTGCDYSVKMVYEAGRINEDKVSAKKADFIIADAKELPLSSGSFDKLLLVATLYYLDDIEQTFGEFRRVLKDKGKLIISIRPKETMEKYGTANFTGNMYTREEFEAVIENNGFSLISMVEHTEPHIRILEEDVPSNCLIAVALKK
jgi:ubiquinone/menaquinone biosynthesis C-methylase UbiE